MSLLASSAHSSSTEAMIPTIALLSKGLARYRYNFTEHFAKALDGRAKIIAAPLGDDLWEVDFQALKQASGCVRYCDFPRTWQELDAWQPNLIGIMEYSLPMLRALLWAKVNRVPAIVFTELGIGEPMQADTKLHTKWMHRVFASLTAGQVALAPAARQPFGAVHRPVHFAPHSIDTHEFTVKTWTTLGDSCTLLTVAQYLPRKGLDLMAEALVPLIEKHRFHWRIVGTQDPAWLREVVAKAGLTAHTTIVGAKQGAALLAEFKQADAFVLPSRFDTYGVVCQEAAASGLPLIVSKFAGASQTVVREGVNGFIIDPYDHAAFTQCLEQLIAQPARWQLMGQESRKLAEHYSVHRVARETAEWMLGFVS
jgi:glycosyltransferase involved in cell wall biosynthesis